MPPGTKDVDVLCGVISKLLALGLPAALMKRPRRPELRVMARKRVPSEPITSPASRSSVTQLPAAVPSGSIRIVCSVPLVRTAASRCVPSNARSIIWTRSFRGSTSVAGTTSPVGATRAVSSLPASTQAMTNCPFANAMRGSSGAPLRITIPSGSRTCPLDVIRVATSCRGPPPT
jgi:hypothetical protein